jgi:hypothetical protein
LPVAKEYLDIIKKNFSDCDIYIWINYGSIKEWVDLIQEYKQYLSITYSFVEEYLNINSDASAYQLWLRLLKDSWKEYNLVRFFHTKWVTKNRDYIRQEIYNRFLNRRTFISMILADNSLIWSYGPYITATTVLWSFDESLEKICAFTHAATNTFFCFLFMLSNDILYQRFCQMFLKTFLVKIS